MGSLSYEDHADQLVEKYDVKSGYWWIEVGGDYDDIIKQAEDIRYELYQIVYGVWDHIKNHGDHGAENYELDWVGVVGAFRESRRLVGDFMLTENDIISNNESEDGVAYGGWPMDEHTAGGFHAKGVIPSKVRSFPGLYAIPYGCYCSRNIQNLMMAGRDISASKLAFGSTRVMGTCAIGGQAAGTAAAMAALLGETPREFGKNHIQDLRQELMKNDCYILGGKNKDKKDFARNATVTASSEKKGFEAINVISGVTRKVGKESNLWISDGIRNGGETLTLKLSKVETLKEARLVFDPDLSAEICISVSKAFIEKEKRGIPENLVKDFDISLLKSGKTIISRRIRGNYQRLCVVDFGEPVEADTMSITVYTTNGCADARIFEVRIY